MYLEGAKTYQTETGMYNVLKKYVDEIEKFKIYELNDFNLKNENIKTRILNIVINDIDLSKHHLNALNKIVNYAKNKGIKISVTILK